MTKEGAKTMLVRDLNHDEVLAVSGGGLLATAVLGAIGGAAVGAIDELAGDGLQWRDSKKIAIKAGEGALVATIGRAALRYNYVGQHRA